MTVTEGGAGAAPVAADEEQALAGGGATQRIAPPAAIVVFGASGDLAAKKLLPALGALAARGSLPDQVAVVGVGRKDLGDDGFRDRFRESLESSAAGLDEAGWSKLEDGLRYVSGGYDDPDTFERLGQVLEEMDSSRGTAGNRIFYLSTPPEVFAPIVECLGAAGLLATEGDAFARVVIEKPFGTDLGSARELDRRLHGVLAERQIFRIDHYLGKETVQNVLALRFANAVFEPLWDRRYVDSVQITVAEEGGIGGRAGFYESAGALRDIMQNHLLQVLAITAMEPPAFMSATSIRDEKAKVLAAVDRPSADVARRTVVRGQYRGYLDEEGVDRKSRTETYVAMRLEVDNWRWAGVPFYLRTGKCLPSRVTEVALQFRSAPHLPFAGTQASQLHPNALVLRIQPDEGVKLSFGAKVPGEGFVIRSVGMDFNYAEGFSEPVVEAYERLLLDALVGDATLFIRSDEVERAWRIVQPVLDVWADDEVPLHRYAKGSWGPEASDHLLAAEGRSWRQPG